MPDDTDDACAYCHCPIESHTINGCDQCPCGMSVFWDDDRGDELFEVFAGMPKKALGGTRF